MFKKLFGKGDEKPKNMSLEEALDILKYKSVREETLYQKAQTFKGEIEANPDYRDLFDSKNPLKAGTLKALQLEVERFTDPLDIHDVERNKKVKMAITTLERNEWFSCKLAYSLVGMSAGMLSTLVVFAISNRGYLQNLDKNAQLNTYFGLSSAGGAIGLGLARASRRRRNDKDISDFNEYQEIFKKLDDSK
jgi:hypothetical protein